MNKKINIKENCNRTFEPSGSKFIETCSKWFLIFCIFLAGIVTYIHVVYEVAPVSGISMQNTLNKDGDALHDTVVINVFMKYKVGDIVVIDRSINKDNKNFHIKRVVAMEGDVINFVEVDGLYYLKRNGKIVEENYIKNKADMIVTYNNYHTILRHKAEFKNYFDEGGNLTIPKDSIFVLGDNRANSEDGAINGPYSKKSVVGYVQYVVPSGTTVVQYFLTHFFELPKENKKLYKNV